MTSKIPDMPTNRFNLRAYGILIRDGRVLLSEEHYKGKQLIKFPGGGVEYGEGIQDALIREWREEMSCDIQVEDMFYVTDYFIQSAFIAEDQIVSFYYTVSSKTELQTSFSEHQIYWTELIPANADKLTFQQDKEVFLLACEIL